jgi:hypothetical protein
VSESLSFEPGDVFALVTDGVAETGDNPDAERGLERVSDLLGRLPICLPKRLQPAPSTTMRRCCCCAALAKPAPATRTRRRFPQREKRPGAGISMLWKSYWLAKTSARIRMRLTNHDSCRARPHAHSPAVIRNRRNPHCHRFGCTTRRLLGPNGFSFEVADRAASGAWQQPKSVDFFGT